MGLDGRHALVTGSTQGLGLAVARSLYDAGASVMLSGRRGDVGAALVAGFADQERVDFFECDLTDRAQVEGAVASTEARFGRLDVLVNNVGGVRGNAMGPFVDVDDDSWLSMFQLNVHSAFYATRVALPAMVERGWGRVVNMSSVEGKQGFAGQVAYVTTKHALVGFTKAVAQEVSMFGVTVNAICPGLCATESVTDMDHLRPYAESLGMTPEQLVATFTEKTATKKLVEPSEVGDLVTFLATDAAASITGAQLSVDGGQSSF